MREAKVVSWASSREARALSANRRASVAGGVGSAGCVSDFGGRHQQHRRVVAEHRLRQLGFPGSTVPDPGDGGIEALAAVRRQRTDAVEVAAAGQRTAVADRRATPRPRSAVSAATRPLSMIMLTPDTLAAGAGVL